MLTTAVPHSAPGASVDPKGAWTCPASHPVKAVFNSLTRECTYHAPGGPHYDQVKPDVCFAAEEDARAEDCWKAGEVL